METVSGARVAGCVFAGCDAGAEVVAASTGCEATLEIGLSIQIPPAIPIGLGGVENRTASDSEHIVIKFKCF